MVEITGKKNSAKVFTDVLEEKSYVQIQQMCDMKEFSDSRIRIMCDSLRCAPFVDIESGYRSIGTLGGGNHFIEIDRDEEVKFYLVIHSGSRNIGLQTAEYYQEEGYKALVGVKSDIADSIVKELKESGCETEIESVLRNLKFSMNIPENFSRSTAWLSETFLIPISTI